MPRTGTKHRGPKSAPRSGARGLDLKLASALAQLARRGLDREFPNKPGEVLRGPRDLRSPAAMHPAFYGCFDWHSSVHGHWLLVRLLRVFPALPAAAAIRARLSAHLTAANLAAEAAYFAPEANQGFERMYGWAWALRLAAELRAWDDPEARRWANNLRPLEHRLVALIRGFLPRLTHPVRTGLHPDTAFALAQVLDYARTVGNPGLAKLAAAKARHYYLADRDYPITYEPSGEDFFSPGLNEADLMRRVLPAAELSAWLDGFIPGLRTGDLGNWSQPARVSDPADGRLVHLAGLNLSRAWTLRGVAEALPPADFRRATLEAARAVHEAAGLKYVFSGHYEGEHWLATFAVYHFSNAGKLGRARAHSRVS